MNIHKLYRPFLQYFRTRRMQRFLEVFEVNSQTRILDVGGDPFNWTLVQRQESPQVIYANLYARRGYKNWIIADGCALPFKDRAFDIVYSNSVIEHLGNLENQKQFAFECQRVGVRYYLQTPNSRFFIKPHLMTPFIHWLPRRWQRRLLRRFSLWGIITRPDAQACDRFLEKCVCWMSMNYGSFFPTPRSGASGRWDLLNH